MFVDTPATIAVLGAGPIGLEAALYARYLGYTAVVFDRGRVCENVLGWGHVRMFSPFGMNASPLGQAALAAQDDSYSPPGEDELLTGREWVDRYLLPLAQSDLLSDSVHQQTTVVAVGRSSFLKGERIGQPERAEEGFRILLRDGDGKERFAEADVVIDTTGTFGNPNWLGAGGIPAVGEFAARERIDYGLPDILGTQRNEFARRHTLVVGGGYSAATNVAALAELASQSPGTHVTWLTRSDRAETGEGPIPRIPNDRLPARDELARRANELAAAGNCVTHLPGIMVSSIQFEAARARFAVELESNESPLLDKEGPEAIDSSDDATRSGSPLATESTLECDRIIANVGYRPDASIYEELQVHLCYATGGPMKLAAALLRETSANCLDQTSHGPQSLLTTEPNFYILGSKSYGRNSNFLVSVGLAQIRDLFTVIGGRENLDLYATMRGAT